MPASRSGLLFRLTAFAAWIFAPERLATNSSPSDETAHGAGDRAQSPRVFLRTLLSAETLPPAPPPAAQPGSEGRARGSILRWLFGRESLPMAPSVDAGCATPPRAGLPWLLSREPLAVDEPAAAPAPAARGVSLGWLLRCERLEPSPPLIGPHENQPSSQR